MSQTRSRDSLIIGLMSGTSHDGVDAALTSMGGGQKRQINLVHHTHIKYPRALQERIRHAFAGSAKDICQLNSDLGAIFAKAAIKCVTETGVSMSEIEAIASHGQTIYHIPPRGKKHGSTLQIGDSSVIASICNRPVVSDFRQADMALGGQGAPLVPFADYLMFQDRATCAVHNIGGISNTTIVTPRLDEIVAFDTGPGNSLIDAAMLKHFNRAYDRSGKIARTGKLNARLLDDLLKHPYFKKRPPKSTGKELFGAELVDASTKGRRLAHEDIVCTMTHLSVESIARAYERFVLKQHKINEIIITGGGSANKYLMELLSERMAPIKIITIDKLGIPASAKEAMSFAVLGYETLRGRPSSVPSATGASGRAVLGKITPAP